MDMILWWILLAPIYMSLIWIGHELRKMNNK